jgi:hypothetical protein
LWIEANPGKQFHETLSGNNPSQKKAGDVTQDADPELKLQYWGKKKCQGPTVKLGQ